MCINSKRETPLHYSARFGSPNLNSILVKAGAMTETGATRTPQDMASRAGRGTVVRMFDEFSSFSTGSIETVTINGIHMTKEMLLEYQKCCTRVPVDPMPENEKSRKRNATNFALEATNQLRIQRLLYSAFDINMSLLSVDVEDTTIWRGFISMFDEEDDNTPSEERYCTIEKGEISVFSGTPKNEGKLLRTISFKEHCSFGVYCADFYQFSAVRFTAEERGRIKICRHMLYCNNHHV